MKDYVTKRTDRTPENREGTAKFLRLITVISLVTALTCIHLLNMHQENTVDLVMRSSNSLPGSSMEKLLERVYDSVASMQCIFFFSFILHSIVHFLTHRLDVLERSIPRIVDLQAAGSVPKKDQ